MSITLYNHIIKSYFFLPHTEVAGKSFRYCKNDIYSLRVQRHNDNNTKKIMITIQQSPTSTMKWHKSHEKGEFSQTKTALILLKPLNCGD